MREGSKREDKKWVKKRCKKGIEKSRRGEVRPEEKGIKY